MMWGWRRKSWALLLGLGLVACGGAAVEPPEASAESDGSPALFTSDGTPGTATLLTFWDEVSTPREFTAFKGRLYFVAEESDDVPGAGVELWVSDGTPAGTGRLVDLRPGEVGASPGALTVFEDLLYFAADDGVHGREPWKVFQGRARLVEDIVPGPVSSAPRVFDFGPGEDPVFARAGSYLFFSTEALELWSMKTGAYCPSGQR